MLSLLEECAGHLTHFRTSKEDECDLCAHASPTRGCILELMHFNTMCVCSMPTMTDAVLGSE